MDLQTASPLVSTYRHISKTVTSPEAQRRGAAVHWKRGVPFLLTYT